MTSTRAWWVGFVLVLLLSCGLALAVAWGPLQVRRENARLKSELLREQYRLRELQRLRDTLQAPARRPAPARPQTFST
jgi:hypothetical protein